MSLAAAELDDIQGQRNRMRVLFLDPAFRSTAWRLIMGEGNLAFAAERFPAAATPRMRQLFNARAVQVEYEVDGWDARLKMPGVVRDVTHGPLRDVYLRLEPTVGDEFPAILRSLKSKFETTFGEWRALIIDRFDAEGASLDDVKQIFEPNDISVLTVAEIRAAMPQAEPISFGRAGATDVIPGSTMTLAALERAIDLVALRGYVIDLGEIPLDDARTYTMLGRGETVGIFQLESSLMRKALVSTPPSRFEDLIALVVKFADRGFNSSHAAASALLTYWTAFFKAKSNCLPHRARARGDERSETATLRHQRPDAGRDFGCVFFAAGLAWLRSWRFALLCRPLPFRERLFGRSQLRPRSSEALIKAGDRLFSRVLGAGHQ